jgi:hypothetical protein
MLQRMERKLMFEVESRRQEREATLEIEASDGDCPCVSLVL